MSRLSDQDPGRASRTRVVGLMVMALLVGTALGPSVADATAGAWVRIQNWPKKVLVISSAATPLYTRPPTHTIVNLHGGLTMPNSETGKTAAYYKVPADKWLVITSVRMEGNGVGPIDFVTLQCPGTIGIPLPILLTTDNGRQHLTTNINGPIYVPPSTQLSLAVSREMAGGSSWIVYAWTDGYLTDKP